MSTLSQRGPNATTPAKMPGIQTSRVADPSTRQALEALREWVEVRLGSRGDKWERAVTERRLEERLTQLQKDAPTTSTTSRTITTAPSTTTPPSDPAIAILQSKVAQLSLSIAWLQGGLAEEQAAIDALQAGGTFEYAQMTASSTWVIEHNLGKHPSVTVIDSGGDEVEGHLVYDSDDQLTLIFSAAFSGTAYLN